MKSLQNFFLVMKNLELHSAVQNITKGEKRLICHKRINEERFDFHKNYMSESFNVSENDIIEFLNLISIP